MTPPCQAKITARHSPSTVSTQAGVQPSRRPAARAAAKSSTWWASTMPPSPLRFFAAASSRSSRSRPVPIRKTSSGQARVRRSSATRSAVGSAIQAAGFG